MPRTSQRLLVGLAFALHATVADAAPAIDPPHAVASPLASVEPDPALPTVDVHEMGHVFGLAHVCHPKASGKPPTSIMASDFGCGGSGGMRNVGFNAEQVATIRRWLDKTWTKVQER